MRNVWAVSSNLPRITVLGLKPFSTQFQLKATNIFCMGCNPFCHTFACWFFKFAGRVTPSTYRRVAVQPLRDVVIMF